MKLLAFSISTTLTMSTSHNIMAKPQEPVEMEEVSKLGVDEEQLPPLQYIYETDETTDEDPSDEEAFKQMPPRKQCIYNKMIEFQKEL